MEAATHRVRLYSSAFHVISVLLLGTLIARCNCGAEVDDRRGPPTVTFTAPTITPGTTPPVADVEGTSPVAVVVTSALPLKSVTITADGHTPVAQWTTNLNATTFQQPVDWMTVLGPGMHELTASVTDTEEDTGTAMLPVNVGQLTIAFTQPTITSGTMPPVAVVGASGPVAVAVTSPSPLTSVTITFDSGQPLTQWGPNPTGSTFERTVAWQSTVGSGMHQLTATATDEGGSTATATLEVEVQMLSIAFTQPTITAGTSPPVADVLGTSPVAVAVTSALPLASVVITYDNDQPLASWSPDPTGFTFQQNVAWAVTMGNGNHLLTAVTADTAGNMATATLEVSTALDPCGIANQTVVITCPPTSVPACGSCPASSIPEEMFNLAVVPGTVTQNGGTFEDMYGNLFSFDPATCTLTLSQYGPTTSGAECHFTPDESVAFAGSSGPIAIGTDCEPSCTLCSVDQMCTASF